MALGARAAAAPIFVLLYLLGVRRKASWIASLGVWSAAAYGAAFGLAAAVLGGAALLGSAAPETRPGEPAMPHAVTGPGSRVR